VIGYRSVTMPDNTSGFFDVPDKPPPPSLRVPSAGRGLRPRGPQGPVGNPENRLNHLASSNPPHPHLGIATSLADSLLAMTQKLPVIAREPCDRGNPENRLNRLAQAEAPSALSLLRRYRDTPNRSSAQGKKCYTTIKAIHMRGHVDSRSRHPRHRMPLECFLRRSFRVVGRILPVVIAVFAFVVVFTPDALAQIDPGLVEFGQETDLSTRDVRESVARIINIFLGLLGTIAVGIILWGGVMIMLSGGDEKKVKTGKDILTNGTIGLAIVLMSFGIVQFIFSRVRGGGGSPTVTIAGGGGLQEIRLTGALGAGPIVSHFPGRGQEDVPRNTRIFITFREPINPESFIDDTDSSGTFGTIADAYKDLAKPEAIQMAPVGTKFLLSELKNARTDPKFWESANKLTPVAVSVTEDLKTIVLMPVALSGTDDSRAVRLKSDGATIDRELLGNDNAPTSYIVRLSGGMQLADSSNLFTGAFSDGYAWDFTVSREVDLTPPKLTSVIPFPDTARDVGETVNGTKDEARNTIVQLNFNEPMDPTTTSATVTQGQIDASPPSGFTKVQVMKDGARIPGTFENVNQYRSVEFITKDACGQNSCGGTVYCLPADADIQVVADAATIDTTLGAPTGTLFSGLMDAAGNSFDGNGNGVASGPGAPRFDLTPGTDNTGASDSIRSQFFTTNEIDLVPPTLEEIRHKDRSAGDILYPGNPAAAIPDVGVEAVALDESVIGVFSKLMSGNVPQAISLDEVSGALNGCDIVTGAGCLWFEGRTVHVKEDGSLPSDADDVLHHSQIEILHPDLRDVIAGFPVPQYRVRIDSSAKDLRQNCFFSVDGERGPSGPAGGQRCVDATGVDCTSSSDGGWTSVGAP
jgi:hypothetical protein